MPFYAHRTGYWHCERSQYCSADRSSRGQSSAARQRCGEENASRPCRTCAAALFEREVQVSLNATGQKDCVRLTVLGDERDDSLHVLAHKGIRGNAASVSMHSWKRKVVLQMRCPWWWKRVMVFCRSAGVCRLVELVMGSESVNAPRLYSDDPSCSSLLGDQSYRCVEGDLPLGKPGDIFNDRSICHREERFALGRCPTLSGDI